MSQIMKGFLGIFMILFLVSSAVGILSAFLTVMDAQDLHESVINEIEDSNYSWNVLAENFEKVENSGYQLEVVLYYADGGQAVCSSGTELPSDSRAVTLARVDLRFPFQVGFFGVNEMHTLSGYAR